MTIQSMTGFGGAEAAHAGWSIKVECRSVNHRGLDVRVWAPRDWNWVEPFVLDAARQRLARGRVEVRVEVAPAQGVSGVTPIIDAPMFAHVASRLREAADAAGLAPPTVADVLAVENVLVRGASMAMPDDIAPFEATVIRALDELMKARAEEGLRLSATMDSLVDEVAAAVAAVGVHSEAFGHEVRERLEQRVLEALERFGAGDVDERSIAQEVALYVERSNVAEELQRAASHIEKLRAVFAADGAVGKQVDFYLQELFREANTTGSKSSSLAVTEHVIAMKTAIEKMREQAANIE